MKKVIYFVLSLIAAFSFFSCTEDSTSPYLKFADYDTFEANKASWIEPESYSFSYSYCNTLNYYQPDITVTVSNGAATFQAADSSDVESYQKFNSISAIYEYFDNQWKALQSQDNTNLGILFSVEYSSKDNVVYPKSLVKSVKWCGSGNAPIGVGGDVIIDIKSISLEN